MLYKLFFAAAFVSITLGKKDEKVCVEFEGVMDDINNGTGLPPSKFPYRNKHFADPIGLISELIGTWYSENGEDTIFGVTTYYTEIVTFKPMNYGILNPRFSNITTKSHHSGGEEILGVSFNRQIISNDKNDGNHLFPPSTPIHEETGYILLMFILNENGEQPMFKRIVKSLAIPRGQTVLAHAEYDDGDVQFQFFKNVVKYTLKSGDIQQKKEYVVANAGFLNFWANVTSFEQTVEIDLNAHTFTYNQSTPLRLRDNTTWSHINTAILTKLDV